MRLSTPEFKEVSLYKNLWRYLILLSTALLVFLAPPARADIGSQSVEFAATGRFDELQNLMESEQSKHALKTRDLHALCFSYSKTKRYNKLMPCLDRLADNVSKGDRRTRLFGLDDATPTIYIMRADALIEMAQYPAATIEAKKGLDWLRSNKSDDKDMEINCLAALSLAATLSGNRADGEKFALELAKVNTSFLNSDYANAKAMALGRVYMALGDYAKALDGINSDKTFKLKSFLDNLVSGAMLRGVNNWAWADLPRGFMIHKAQFETGKIAESKAGYEELLKIPATRENGEIYWLILTDLGTIARNEGATDSSINYYKQAIDVIEAQRATINTESNKIGFVGDKQKVYSQIIAELFDAKRMSEAYEYIERAKARSLVDLLADKNDFSLPMVANVSELLASYRVANNDALAQVPIDMSNAQVAPQRNLVRKRASELSAAAPELASLVSVGTVSTKEIQDRLMPDEVIVEYYFQGQDLYVMTVSSTGAHGTKLDSTGIEALVRNFRSQLQDENDDAVKSAQALYDKLLRPIESDISNRDLLIVPHGYLHYVPFAALNNGHEFLVQTRALRYLPSASILKYLKPTRTKVPDRILVFGNPDLGNSKLDLPNAEKEARMIAAMSPKNELLVRDKASKVAFEQFAPGFHYLHIASHGQFNTDKPLDSRLFLAGASLNDGALTVNELYGIRLDADLVTLSACETGLGKVLNGDDVVGLTRGFLYAGSSNVVSSLWQVDDLATSELMEHFYTNLNNNMTKRDALRQAQLDTQKKFPHPFFWASFFLTGQGI